jgi:outer membrane lipoprotein-sorting protein
MRSAQKLMLATLQISIGVGYLSAQQNDAITLLNVALKQYQGLTHYRAEVLQIYDFPATKSSAQYHRTILASGGKTYAEQQEPFHLLTIVDGVNIWQYAPERLEYTQRPFTPAVEPIEISSLQRLAASSIVNARQLPDQTVSLQGEWDACSVIQATFNIEKGPGEATFWVDKSEGVIRKVVYTSANNQTVTTVILSLNTTTQVPESQFAFTPPSNAVRLALK